MIQTLLTQIQQQLQTDLTAILAQPTQQITHTPIPDSPTQTQIAIYPDKLDIQQTLNSPNSLQPHPQTEGSELIVRRDFQQHFCIEIYATDPHTTEQLASLITGLILTRTETLITTFNTSPVTYKAAQTETTHTLRSLHLLTGTYAPVDSGLTVTLHFQVIGQLKLSHTLAEAVHVIAATNISLQDLVH